MEFDLSNYKITIGSINVSPREDPINGPNGTAVTTRFNNFVGGVQDLFNQALPNNQGGLVTTTQEGKLIELSRGPSLYCLVSSPLSESGLAYEPRVDLTTDQVIGGKKSFTALVTMNGFISNEESQVLSDLLVDGILSADRAIVQSTLNVKGNATLQSLLDVGGNSSLRARLDVTGQSTFGAGVVINQGLTVAGGTSLGNNLSVGGPVNLQSTLSVQGLSNLTSLEATGYIQALGSLSANEIVSSTNLTVGETATIGGDLIVGSNFNVKGSSSFNNLQVGDLNSTGAVNVGGPLSVTGNVTTNGVISSKGGSVNGDLQVAGQVTTQDLTVSDTLLVQGLMDLPNGLEVGQRLTIQGDLIVSGVTTLQSPVSGTSANFTGAVNIGNSLSADTLIVRSSSTLQGPVKAEGSVTVMGALATNSNVNVGGSLTSGGPITTTSSLMSASVSTNAITAKAIFVDTLRVNQDANLQANLLVTGNVTSSSVTTGDLTAQGVTNLADVTINGDLTLTNPISIPGLSGTNTGDEPPATPTRAGVVLIDTLAIGEPMVYTKASVDSLFIRQTDTNLVRLDNSTGFIPEQFIPPRAYTKPTVVASEGAMLSLVAQEGDIAIRSDINQAFILSTGAANQLSNWVPLNFNLPSNLIQSVFGRVGDVLAQEGDYTAQLISYTNSAQPTITNVHSMLGLLYNLLIQHGSDSNNPHRVTIEQLNGVPMSLLGVPQGVAVLDSEGYVTNLRPTRLEHSFTQADVSNNQVIISHSLGATPLVQVYSGAQVLQTDLQVTANNTQVIINLSGATPITGNWKVVLLS